MHRPLGTRVKYDEEGNVIPPLAALADMDRGDGALHPDKGVFDLCHIFRVSSI